MRVTKKGYFAAAHHLPGYMGKCARNHGHTWLYEVTVTADLNTNTGMVLDFHDLKATMEQFDHSDLNDFLEMPTCENIAKYLVDSIVTTFTQVAFVGLTLWESPDSSIYTEFTKA
jgi:6-pyruvoyltetrahydropterin/6-carboxytetrahydropterin synthase